MRLTLVYAIVASIAMMANLAAQQLVLTLTGGALRLMWPVAVGTGVGLLVKYVLDKRFVFCFRAAGIGHDARLFVLYAGLGLVTTLVFWGFEFGFQWWFGTAAMRYAGATLGLALGYLAKFHLDRRFVFCGTQS
ncbi:MAG: GtrA family protein [Betaproteobacteria bacterium]|nr:GtrA family protein [Betaproteobacteria bacterium]